MPPLAILLTTRMASRHCSCAAITSPNRRHHLRLRIVLFLRFHPAVPSLCPSGKRPRKNQGRTKDEQTNSQTQKSAFVKIAVSFPSFTPCLIPPRDDRENTERRAKRYRALAAKNSALFLRLLS